MNARYHVVEDGLTDYVSLEVPGAIRWATSRPEDGFRSLTWQVVGARNSDDIYVGARGMMKDLKLSLHESGVWRYAYTPPLAAKILPPGADSLINRYCDVPHFAPGWRIGAVIRTPNEMLGERFDEPRPRDKQPIRLIAPPDPPKSRQYLVLIGDPGAALTVKDAFDVGRMTLRSGLRVWIIATEKEPTDADREVIALMQKQAAADPEARVGIASGYCDKAPLLLDVRRLKPDQPAA